MADKSGREREMLAAHATIAGNLYATGVQNRVSPFPFEDRVRETAKAGYTGIGLMREDFLVVEGRLGLRRMKEILDEHGIRHIELESLRDWYADGDRKLVADRARAEFLRAAEMLRPRYIKTGGDPQGFAWPEQRMIDEFARLCQDAAKVGTQVGIELTPWSNLSTINAGLRVVQAADQPNGGLILDIFHLMRAHVPFEDIARVRARDLVHIELNDGASERIGSAWDDAVHRRKLCGEGDFDITDFLRRIEAIGYTGVYGVEIMSDEHRTRSLVEAATRSATTTRRALEQAYSMAPAAQ